MTRTIKIATIQLDVSPAPTSTRLNKAEKQVIAAAEAGAQLVALPELFNTGYIYSDANFEATEPLGGSTATWMKKLAARLNIHLAGSLLIYDSGEIYNALLLFAPDGRLWRYNKNYPWAWERGYFRGAQETRIAHTDLGDLGMLICWDAAHLPLWQQYAGQVDAMLITSCPPNVGYPTYRFPDGATFGFEDVSAILPIQQEASDLLFGDMVNQQTAWLGVPAVNTGGCGQVNTPLPKALGSLLFLLPFFPWLAKYLPRADQLTMQCDMTSSAKIVAANGHVLAQCDPTAEEGFALAEVTLAAAKPTPSQPQPASLVSWLTYFSSDVFIPRLVKPIYERGLRYLGRRDLIVSHRLNRLARWLVGAGLGVLGVWVIVSGLRKSDI